MALRIQDTPEKPLRAAILALCALGCTSVPANDAGPADGPVDASAHPECIDELTGGPGRYYAWAGANGEVSYQLWRCETVPPVGGDPRFRVDRFVLRFGGATYEADVSRAAYTSTHHGWNDALEAPTLPPSAQAILRWRTSYDGSAMPARYFVSADAPGGGVLLPETEMPNPW